MGKRISLTIKESSEELTRLYKTTKNYRQQLRIKSLLLTQEGRFKNREELASFLGVSTKTLFNWTASYKSSGLEAMLSISNGGKRREVITPDIHEGLSKKLQDSSNPFKGYWEAVEWVEEHFGVSINYRTLRSYMKKHFGTKLKTPRKSHYKKDEQAIEAFKKTS